MFSKHHACVILWKCFKLCLHKARGVDSLGPPHPGRHPRGQPPRPACGATPPAAAALGAAGHRAGRPLPCALPPTPRRGAAHRRPGPWGPSAARATGAAPWGHTLSVYPARPRLRAVLPHSPLAHAVHTTETTPAHRPSRPPHAPHVATSLPQPAA